MLSRCCDCWITGARQPLSGNELSINARLLPPTGESVAASSHLLLEPGLQVREGSVLSEGLHAHAISLDLALRLQLVEVGHNVLGETVFTGDKNLLAAGELELGSSEGLASVVDVGWLGSDGDQDGADVDTGRLAKSLSVSVSHTGLESIGTSARKHLVDANNVPWVDSNSNVESQFTSVHLHVLVGSNTGSLKSLGGDLFLLVRNEMDAAGELVPLGLLVASVVDTDLRVGHTTVEARLGVGLVFLVSVATRWSSSHFYKIITNTPTPS
jgi:hypothetical protein